jgi:hypothetical protein
MKNRIVIVKVFAVDEQGNPIEYLAYEVPALRKLLRIMRLKTLRIGQLLLYAALSLVDLALTYRLLERGGGHVYESNPVANAWLSAYGWMGLAAFKLACMALVISVATLLLVRRPRAADHLLLFACTAVALVVLYSCSLVGFFGKGFPTAMQIQGLAEVSQANLEGRPQLPFPRGHSGRLFFKRPGVSFRSSKQLLSEISGPPPSPLGMVSPAPQQNPPR